MGERRSRGKRERKSKHSTDWHYPQPGSSHVSIHSKKTDVSSAKSVSEESCHRLSCRKMKNWSARPTMSLRSPDLSAAQISRQERRLISIFLTCRENYESDLYPGAQVPPRLQETTRNPTDGSKRRQNLILVVTHAQVVNPRQLLRNIIHIVPVP